jgi:hypothetical protein
LQLSGAIAGEDLQLVEKPSVLTPVKERADADEIFYRLVILFK